MLLSPFYLWIDYVPPLVGSQLFGYTLQAISHEGNSANSRAEKLREKASNNLFFLFLHPNNSNAKNAKSLRVYSVVTCFWPIRSLFWDRNKRTAEKKEKKKVILVSCCYVFSACLLYPFPPILSLSYAVCKLFETGTSFDVSVCICILL